MASVEESERTLSQTDTLNQELYRESEFGHLKEVERLLDNGADVNAQGGFFGNALQAASCSSGDNVEVVKLLLERGADVNAQGGSCGSALQAASCSSGDNVEVVKLLLERGADVNAQGGSCGSALQAASCSSGDNVEVVKLLLERGADVNAQGGSCGSALQAASCSSGDNVEVVKLLLERGADVNAQGGHFGNALQAASHSSRDNVEVVKLLLERGADVNAQGGHFGNALQAASHSSRDNVEVVKLLLERGADVNAQGGYFGNALQAVAAKGHEEVVKLLLERGADVNARGGSYSSALQAAAAEGHEEVVKLLLERGADVNAQGGLYGSALQAVSYEGYVKVVKLLLERGADVNAQGGIYGSALRAASSRGDEEMVKLLLERGADVNAQGGLYGSALHAAAAGGHEEVVKLLLEREAGVNAQDGSYGSALQAAAAKGHQKVVKMLRERAADVNAQRLQAASLSEDHGKNRWPDKEADVNAQSGQYDNALQTASYKGHKRGAFQVAAESNLGLGETTQVPIPEETRDDSSDFGSEVMGDDDEDSGIGDPTATEDDSSGSGCEIMSDGDEDLECSGPTPPQYDSPLASLRDRISKPVEYFDGLRALAHLVYQNSMLQTYSKSYSPRMVVEQDKCSEPCPRYLGSLKQLTPDVFDPIADSDVVRICQDAAVTHNAFARDLLEILECRNVNAQTYSNLRRLQLHGFCLQKISILTIDPHRHNVARLLPIDIQHMLQLLKEIESVLRKTAESARHAPPSVASAKALFEQALGEQDDLLLSVPYCTNFLTTLGLDLASPSVTRINLSIPAVLRLVANTVDLAVASYAGAHLSRFDEEYLGEDIAVIDVLGPFASLHKSQIPSFKLSRCQLQCLDVFHNSQPVWVFSSSDWEPRGHLFLSTKVEDFADIWGPLWKVVDPKVHSSCTRYVVGNGCIYKWKSQKATPRLLENEILCHWISNTTIERGSENSSNKEELVFPDSIDEGFDGNETLLIGAVAAGCERLALKRNCNFDLDRTRAALDHDGRVQMLGTVKEHTYKDSETYQLQVGHNGVNASASKQYKRRGQSLKQAFVEAWTTTPELRDPRLLQDFYGVEVSLCTQNAQRIQLGRILGLGSMCQYLRSFRWKTDSAKQAYFDALKGFREDGDALQRTWEKHDQYQDDFGRAVLVCLKALEKTGINHKGQMTAFLSSQVTARPELIAMEPREHSWIGILKDSESSCCMAVIGDDCLEFKHELGSTCGQSGRSVLRTALVINCRNKPRGLCKKYAYSHEAADGWSSRWSVRTMAIKSDVWLGKHGTLRLLSHLPEATLLMDWRASQITTAVKNLIDKERPHREYAENVRKEARHTRPVPLFVMSNP